MPERMRVLNLPLQSQRVHSARSRKSGFRADRADVRSCDRASWWRRNEGKAGHSLAFQVKKIPPYWINIFTNNVSEAAYGLGLKSKIVVELEEIPRVIQIRCDGPKQACAVFEAHLNWLLTYINTQPPKS